MNAKELEPRIEEAVREMHHNATLLHIHFDADEDDYDAFDNFLMISNEMALIELGELATKRFGERMDFYQWGRSGATVAPAGYWNRGFNWDLVYDARRRGGLEGYNALRRILAIIEFTNEYVDKYVRGLPDAWRAYKEA